MAEFLEPMAGDVRPFRVFVIKVVACINSLCPHCVGGQSSSCCNR